MAPNLTVLALTLFHPSRWSHSKKPSESGRPLDQTEHWASPVPGTYRHLPGAGWYLIQHDGDPAPLADPDRVIWSEALNAKLLLSDYLKRSKTGKLPISVSAPGSRNSSVTKLPPSVKEKLATPENQRRSSKTDVVERRDVHFVMLEDGVTWLNDKDATGTPTKGPWARYCIDKGSGEFRPMLRGDDPFRSKASSVRAKSVATNRSSDEETRKNGGVSRSSSTNKVNSTKSGAMATVSRSTSKVTPLSNSAISEAT